jgi:hypothetical protein
LRCIEVRRGIRNSGFRQCASGWRPGSSPSTGGQRPGAGKHSIGQSDVVIEQNPELNDTEHDHQQQRQHKRELNQRLASFAASTDLSGHGQSSFPHINDYRPKPNILYPGLKRYNTKSPVLRRYLPGYIFYIIYNAMFNKQQMPAPESCFVLARAKLEHCVGGQFGVAELQRGQEDSEQKPLRFKGITHRRLAGEAKLNRRHANKQSLAIIEGKFKSRKRVNSEDAAFFHNCQKAVAA